jgi:GNAT superfamily N-acetyltransferase
MRATTNRISPWRPGAGSMPNVRPPSTALGPASGQSTPVYPPNYPRDLERDVCSDASIRYRLRPIRPDDAQRLLEFHHHLGSRSIYLRFFSLHQELSPKEVRHFTSVDYINRLALVAEFEGRLIAVGRFDRQEGDEEAEVAFVVADEFQHHGIGSLLLDELVRAARARGIASFRADTLCENRTMLDVFRHAGFPVTSSVDCGTVTFHFPIGDTDAYRASLAERETGRHPIVAAPGHPKELAGA